ncbi:hypothetical protein GIB67_021416 [Kingdonia uniflora]|uniref:Polygalacturonase n=1 Tax=Kingdonia uniflora TaxID=39325 RepID=A0A7J7MCX9_9MAGN|nr:hypothetical protein GIB67_021416 [Kingdonia uniflora]
MGSKKESVRIRPSSVNDEIPTYFIVMFLEQILHLHACNGLQLSGLHSIDSPRAHISLSSTKGALISNIHISAPGYTRNTDGIDIKESSYIQIRDSYIALATGDDCVAIGGGSSYINITHVSCRPGHGFSVRSLGDKGAHEIVEERSVQVSDVSFGGVRGTSSSQDAIKLSCSRTVGCTNIIMQGINIHPGQATVA